MSLFSHIKKLFGKEPEMPNGMECDVFLCSNVGKKRKNNEDNFYLDNGIFGKGENDVSYSYSSKGVRKIFAVFDGMGGEEFGEVASLEAAKTMKEYAKRLINKTDMEAFFKEYAQKANDNICQELLKRGNYSGGCTATIVYLEDFHCIPFNIGDSRIYWLHEGELQQVTEDDTLAMKKYKAHIFTLEEANTSRERHMLTNFLGVDDTGSGIYSDSSDGFAISPEDKFVLCSDGLTDMCSEEEIETILMNKENESNANIAKILVEKALENGGVDNVTCLILENFR